MKITREKNIILAARVVSMLFTPFYLPLVGLMALFLFSYLSLMPWAYKLQVLTLVYVFTILLQLRSREKQSLQQSKRLSLQSSH